MRRLALLMLAAGFIAAPAIAQEEDQEDTQNISQDAFDFERHDTNDDGLITEAEWEDAGNDDFAGVDANDDGYLDENEIRNVQDAGMDPGQVTPEEDYLGTGHDPLSADPTDREPASQETEAAAADGIDRNARRNAEQDSAARTTAIDNSLFETGERESLSRMDNNDDGRISRQEAEPDEEVRENFVSWDNNQDGYLDQSELEVGRDQGQRNEQQQDVSFDDADDDERITRDEVDDVAGFDTLDSNSDGYLDEAEVNYEPGERTVADAAGFDDLDDNSDGRLSRNEAVNNTYMDANFDTWDSDQDGYLDEEEVNNGWLEESNATPDEIW